MPHGEVSYIVELNKENVALRLKEKGSHWKIPHGEIRYSVVTKKIHCDELDEGGDDKSQKLG